MNFFSLNHIVYDNENKIKKLHSRNQIKEVVIPVHQTKTFMTHNNSKNIIFSKKRNNYIPHNFNNKIQEKKIVFRNKEKENNYLEEDKENYSSNTIEMKPKKNMKIINQKSSNQLFDMRQFSFGKKNNGIKKKLSQKNVRQFILNETSNKKEINGVNDFIKYLFNIIGISCELNKICQDITFNDLTFLSKKDLESLGFGIINRNRLSNTVKNFSKFMKEKNKCFDNLDNNKNLKYLYEFLSQNKEVIVDNKSFIELEKNYNNDIHKNQNSFDTNVKKILYNRRRNYSNNFPIKCISRNMPNNLFLNDINCFSTSQLSNYDNFQISQNKFYDTFTK